jgi:hypothetical protein
MPKHKPIAGVRAPAEVGGRSRRLGPSRNPGSASAAVVSEAEPPAGWDQRPCLGTDLKLWFGPAEGEPAEKTADRLNREAVAKRVCAGCPFTAFCLDTELVYGPNAQHGVRGGLDADERRNLIRSRHRKARARQAVA